MLPANLLWQIRTDQFGYQLSVRLPLDASHNFFHYSAHILLRGSPEIGDCRFYDIGHIFFGIIPLFNPFWREASRQMFLSLHIAQRRIRQAK